MEPYFETSTTAATDDGSWYGQTTVPLTVGFIGYFNIIKTGFPFD